MLDDRKAAILRAVVEEYIGTAQPVGSGHVAASPGVQVSPATVRNEMTVLEREGYLVQPHTSAGRTPTEKGYRFYVDRLTSPARLDPASQRQVAEFFSHAHGELERLLAETSRLLGSLTSAAAVVVSEAPDTSTYRSVQLVGLGPRLVMVVAVLSNGVILKHTVEPAEEVADEVVADASARLAAHLVGRARSEAAPATPSGTTAVDQLVAAAAEELGREAVEDSQVFVGGAAGLAASFEAVETVRNVLTILEQQLVVVTLVRDVLDRGLQVAIGTETGVEPLAECALVVAPITVDGEHAGSIGVLGPTRMKYPEAIAAVAAVSRRLGQSLSEG